MSSTNQNSIKALKALNYKEFSLLNNIAEQQLELLNNLSESTDTWKSDSLQNLQKWKEYTLEAVERNNREVHDIYDLIKSILEHEELGTKVVAERLLNSLHVNPGFDSKFLYDFKLALRRIIDVRKISVNQAPQSLKDLDNLLSSTVAQIRKLKFNIDIEFNRLNQMLKLLSERHSQRLCGFMNHVANLRNINSRNFELIMDKIDELQKSEVVTAKRTSQFGIQGPPTPPRVVPNTERHTSRSSCSLDDNLNLADLIHNQKYFEIWLKAIPLYHNIYESLESQNSANRDIYFNSVNKFAAGYGHTEIQEVISKSVNNYKKLLCLPQKVK